MDIIEKKKLKYIDIYRYKIFYILLIILLVIFILFKRFPLLKF